MNFVAQILKNSTDCSYIDISLNKKRIKTAKPCKTYLDEPKDVLGRAPAPDVLGPTPNEERGRTSFDVLCLLFTLFVDPNVDRLIFIFLYQLKNKKEGERC